VNNSNIRKWLPDLPPEFDRLPYAAAATDLVRAGLLAHYGGVYMDTDVLIQRDLTFLTRHLQEAHLVSYANEGQDCQKGTFSSNIMAATKGNALSQAWYVEAKRQLSQNCPLPESQDRDHRQGVCCYTPSGEVRQCHVNWGGLGERIAHPTLTHLLSGPDPSIRTFCFKGREHKDFTPANPNNYASLVSTLPSPAPTSFISGTAQDQEQLQAVRSWSTAECHQADVTKKSDILKCLEVGADLVCCDRKIYGFFSRGAYHLFASNWPASLSAFTSEDIKHGHEAISLLIRRSLPRSVVAQL